MNVKRYIPEKVHQKVMTLDYKDKEHLIVICDMIYRSTIYKKEDKDYKNQFIDIPRNYFRDIFSDYKKHISFLISEGIIESDGNYSKDDKKALGYRFREDHISPLISITIEKKTISRKIIKNKNERNNFVNEKLHDYRDYFLNNFKIDYGSAIEHLNQWFNSLSSSTPPYVAGFLNKEWIKLVNKYNHIFISLSAINDGELFFRKNKTNGRIDTNLTNLKSDYKKFILSDKALKQIDIVNSQPFILSLLFTPPYVAGFLNRGELKLYNDWTGRGIFYEMFERTYFKNTGKTLSRKTIKDMMFAIFYSKNGSYTHEKRIFKSIFPTIMNYIEKEKEGRHNQFAIKLQKIESGICIDVISDEMTRRNIKYFTIHDAWIVSEEAVEETKEIIWSKFGDLFFRRPEIKEDLLSDGTYKERLFGS